MQVCTEHSALPSFGRMLLGLLVQAVQANGWRALCILRATLRPVPYGADSIAFRHWPVASGAAGGPSIWKGSLEMQSRFKIALISLGTWMGSRSGGSGKGHGGTNLTPPGPDAWGYQDLGPARIPVTPDAVARFGGSRGLKREQPLDIA